MEHILLIDGNSIGHAAHNATKLHSGDMETQAVFGFIRTMRELRCEYPSSKLMVLWDGRAEWRFALHPSYKSNRDNSPEKVKSKEAYVAQRPYIARALTHLGIRQMTASTHEADDLAGYIVTNVTKEKPNAKITLITGDKDWLQLVRSQVNWRDLRDDSRKINLSNFEDKTGYQNPYQFLEGKCLQGDSSDCIPGVGGIGAVGAPEFIAEFGGVRNFWNMVDSGEFVPKKKAHINLASNEGRKAFGRNFRMMQLLKVPKPERNNVSLSNGKFDESAFLELCEELAFSSIISRSDQFTRPFRT